jgi:hypothetical protein
MHFYDVLQPYFLLHNTQQFIVGLLVRASSKAQHQKYVTNQHDQHKD